MSKLSKILQKLNESEVNEATDYSKAWTVTYDLHGSSPYYTAIIFADSVKKGKSKSVIVDDDVVIHFGGKIVSVKKGK